MLGKLAAAKTVFWLLFSEAQICAAEKQIHKIYYSIKKWLSKQNILSLYFLILAMLSTLWHIFFSL